MQTLEVTFADKESVPFHVTGVISLSVFEIYTDLFTTLTSNFPLKVLFSTVLSDSYYNINNNISLIIDFTLEKNQWTFVDIRFWEQDGGRRDVGVEGIDVNGNLAFNFNLLNLMQKIL